MKLQQGPVKGQDLNLLTTESVLWSHKCQEICSFVRAPDTDSLVAQQWSDHHFLHLMLSDFTYIGEIDGEGRITVFGGFQVNPLPNRPIEVRFRDMPIYRDPGDEVISLSNSSFISDWSNVEWIRAAKDSEFVRIPETNLKAENNVSKSDTVRMFFSPNTGGWHIVEDDADLLHTVELGGFAIIEVTVENIMSKAGD